MIILRRVQLTDGQCSGKRRNATSLDPRCRCTQSDKTRERTNERRLYLSQREKLTSIVDLGVVACDSWVSRRWLVVSKKDYATKWGREAGDKKLVPLIRALTQLDQSAYIR